MFRIVVAGSRSFQNYKAAEEIFLSALSKRKLNEIEIVSGGAKGADAFGEYFAKKYGCQLKIYPADWERYGKRAGYLRNRQMAENSDATILFWDGVSRGTADMFNQTLRENHPLFVVYYDKETQYILECRDESNPF